jgi:hypothetical protein
MENKINIAEILKDCPKGIELYSPIYGKVELLEVDSNYEYSIKIVTGIERPGSFTTCGRFYENYPSAECLLFPSREMRDWTKFFKRGDVVYNKDGGMYAIFEGWVNDDYTEFNTTINYYESIASFGTEEVCYTDCFVKASDEERAVFIANAEKYYNGKYNPDTLQVEPVKSTCSFKPFDKVLVRDEEEDLWYANFFSHYNEDEKCYPYSCIDTHYRYCIPYNEHTAHLLGTSDPYTEGGSE